MRKLYNIAISVSLLCAFSPLANVYADGPVRVVTSTPDMADFVKEIGGEYVDVYSLSKGKIDLHFFEPRPSHVMKLKDADLLVVGGMDLDIWIKSLIEASRNPEIMFGRNGYVDPSDGIIPLDVPQGRIDGSMGDVHPYGKLV